MASMDASVAYEPIISPPSPVLSRVTWAVRLWSFKIFVSVALGLMRLVKVKEGKKIAATYTKRYSVRPMLENRVFIPSTWTSGTTLPLLIDIHGGGFALADPQTDDVFCHHFANTYNFCVVSINYRKAPSQPFPGLVHDAAEIARAVLADSDLPVDFSKVAMGGFSAGGNITLAIAQLDGIKDKVKALFPVYPVVDFSGNHAGEYRPNKEGKPDMLEKIAPLFNWGYISQGQDRCDPLLSPIFASRQSFGTAKMFFVGAEYDYLCHEANAMAKKLAGLDDKDPAAESESWKHNGIKWRMVPDVQHGFTHVTLKGPAEVERQRICEELYKEAADWLKSEIFI